VTEFQEAAAAARRRYADTVWFTLSVNEQAKAIYAEMRRMDAERAGGAANRTSSPGRSKRGRPSAKLPAARALGGGWLADGLEA
jgi:hypothetical protein